MIIGPPHDMKRVVILLHLHRITSCVLLLFVYSHLVIWSHVCTKKKVERILSLYKMAITIHIYFVDTRQRTLRKLGIAGVSHGFRIELF